MSDEQPDDTTVVVAPIEAWRLTGDEDLKAELEIRRLRLTGIRQAEERTSC